MYCFFGANHRFTVVEAERKVSDMSEFHQLIYLLNETTHIMEISLESGHTHMKSQLEKTFILSDPSTIPYTEEVNQVLQPHKGVLRRLLTSPNSSNTETSSNVIPAKKWLEDMEKTLKKNPHSPCWDPLHWGKSQNRQLVWSSHQPKQKSWDSMVGSLTNCPCPHPLHHIPNDKKPHVQDV